MALLHNIKWLLIYLFLFMKCGEKKSLHTVTDTEGILRNIIFLSLFIRSVKINMHTLDFYQHHCIKKFLKVTFLHNIQAISISKTIRKIYLVTLKAFVHE